MGHPLTSLFGVCDAPPNAVQNLPVCAGPDETRDPVYFSTEYSDPLQLNFPVPVELDSLDPRERTYLYCSLWDNGSGPGSPTVKRQSTSPSPPQSMIEQILDLAQQAFPNVPRELLEWVPEIFIGGPCQANTVACLDGPNKGQLCGGQQDPDAFCGGEGLCDACPAHGGVTTEDEMFILLGNYFVVSEPTTSTTLAPTTTTTTIAPTTSTSTTLATTSTTTTSLPPTTTTSTAPPSTTTSTTLPAQSRVGICHKGRTMLSLPSQAVPAHLGHGDTLGACSSSGKARGHAKQKARGKSEGHAEPAKGNGKAKGHGNGKSNGNGGNNGKAKGKGKGH